MSYRIFYYHGPELRLATKVEKGILDFDDRAITIKSGGNSFHVAFHDVEHVELIRLHKIGRVIRIKHSSGTHFVSIIRFMVGQFALINFLATGRVFNRIQSAVNSKHSQA